MRFTLKNLVLVPAVLAAAVVATNTAMAEVTLKVPFNFTVAGKNCPAGLYSVDRDNAHGLVTLRSKDASKSFTWPLEPGGSQRSGSKVTLQFDETGQTHTLRTVEYGTFTTPKLDTHKKTIESIPTQFGQGR